MANLMHKAGPTASSPARNPPRVLLGLGEVAGYYSGLHQGFCDLGVPVTMLDLSNHPYAYGEGADNMLTRLGGRLSSYERSGVGVPRQLTRALRVLLQGLLLIWAVPRHDLFVFAHGSGFLGQRDLPLLKRLGKTIICSYHGSDARPPYLDGYWGNEATVEDVRRRIAGANSMKRRIKRAERFADAVITIPSQGHFHSKPFVLGLYVGHPTVAAREPVAPPPPSRDKVVCLHAPSQPSAKGTGEIRRIVNRLRDRGVPLTLREVTGVPNHVLHDEIRAADIVIDQLYADYPMPGLATESAWLGRPVIVGGYGAEAWRRILPPERIPPTVYCRPERVELELERLVRDPELRAATGRAARAFVERHWQPRQIAARYLRIADCSIEPNWIYDPMLNRDVHGCFLPEETVREIVRKTIAEGGPSALQLGHNPQLEATLIAFAQRATA